MIVFSQLLIPVFFELIHKIFLIDYLQLFEALAGHGLLEQTDFYE